MSAISTPHPAGREFFTAPAEVNQRRYEALRAYHVEDLTLAAAGQRFGYTRATMASLVRDFRAGRLKLFTPPGKPGRSSAPATDRARGRVVELRRQGLSVHEISSKLADEGTPLNRTSVGQILTEEGFGLLLLLPDLLLTLDLPGLVTAAGYPGTRTVPAISWICSLLALKLTNTRRVSHVDDLLCDPGAALFAGLQTLPKKSALSDYSHRLTHTHQRQLLTALDRAMIGSGLATAEQAIFDLDFHAVMHWGDDPALEKHYVPTRSQRARSVLTFFAQDSGTHNLVYANADLSKTTQARQAIAFCDHWKNVSGADPHMLVMDQKVTTHTILGELDARGVKFLTLRMRSPALMAYTSTFHGHGHVDVHGLLVVVVCGFRVWGMPVVPSVASVGAVLWAGGGGVGPTGGAGFRSGRGARAGA